MKKNLKILFIIILIFALLIPITYSYALSFVEPGKNEKQFFEISKTEFAKNEKIEMIINLDSIKYNEFTFELKSDEVIENLEIDQSEEIEAEKNNNEIVMEINKEKTNVKTINLFYSIPENKNVGDTIKFIATITNNIKNETQVTDREQNEQPIENEEANKEDMKQPTETEEIKKKETTENKETNIIIDVVKKEENKAEINEKKTETQSIEIEIKIIEEKNDNKLENNKTELDDNKIPNQNNATPTTVQKNTTNNSNIQYDSMSNVSIGGNQVAKVTYKGSDNNYLSELSVDGYTLNREFSKENTTYFITVGNEVEEVEIVANVVHDEATVTIYGNKNLKEGTNKILIAVTAENGNVRNYRIYVTKNS